MQPSNPTPCELILNQVLRVNSNQSCTKPSHSSCLRDSRHLSGHGMNFTDKERPTVSPCFQVERQTKAHEGLHEKKMDNEASQCKLVQIWQVEENWYVVENVFWWDERETLLFTLRVLYYIIVWVKLLRNDRGLPSIRLICHHLALPF